MVDNLFRKEYGNIVSFLTSKFGFNFLESAQDITQDTLLLAFEKWKEDGVPNNPKGWLLTVAKNKAINFVKRESKSQALKTSQLKDQDVFTYDITLHQQIEDGMLEMIFRCCSNSIKIESQIILVLNILGGFSRKELASALVLEEETIKKRLYRAKKKIRENDKLFQTPNIEKSADRLNSVLNSLYLLFNQGYNSTSNENLIRKDICTEALRLTQLLSNFYDKEYRVRALLALMCFHIARFESRIDDKGAIVLFKDQDRTLWSRELINKGIVELSAASEGQILSSYHLEAGIALQHCIANSYESTDWETIKHLYLQLYNFKSSPVIKLNLAVVEGITEGPKKAIEILEELKNKSKRLSKYYLLYASLGEFYKQLNRNEDAKINFKQAIELTHNQKEKELLLKKINE
ncbi:sigma-70 family RNA polymerase sigma factor [uncultured Winogradskyella sp.]|uniref:RNA polymerase sigma factor n=1 Tax=uncultured Winogradskyella sp. TaxID=395353 RepID=UPI002624FBBA|nr:sigma-70 family RNA polymerase sigma factor [uncultured Winogradskyella sp.]